MVCFGNVLEKGWAGNCYQKWPSPLEAGLKATCTLYKQLKDSGHKLNMKCR